MPALETEELEKEMTQEPKEPQTQLLQSTGKPRRLATMPMDCNSIFHLYQSCSTLPTPIQSHIGNGSLENVVDICQSQHSFPDGSKLNNPPANQKMWVRYLDQEDPLKKEMATNSNILASEIPQIEDPGGLQGCKGQGMAVIKQLPQTYDIRLFATFYAYGRNLFYLLNNSRMTDFEEYFKICSLYFLINCYREAFLITQLKSILQEKNV